MKTITFPFDININGKLQHFRVNVHEGTDRRFTIEYTDEMQCIFQFELVRTPIGHWVAGGAEIPGWLKNCANEIGKSIASIIFLNNNRSYYG